MWIKVENLLDFYRNVYCGREYEDMERLLKRSSNEIDSVIFMPPQREYQQMAYDFAVCAQAEYMGLCGGIEAWAQTVSGNPSSVTVGSFSVSYGSGSGNASANGICSRSMEYLSKSGLLYRGSDVL